MLSRDQLHALGFNDEQIARRERNSELHELYTDVWAVGRANVTPKGHLIAALLSCGPTTFLSHRTAAALHDLRALNVRAIEVTMVGGCALTRKGLMTHRTAKPPDANEIRTVGLLRYSSVPRLLIELAPRETPGELTRLITEAVRRRRLNLEAMEAALQRHARRPGLAKLKEALRAYRPRPDRKSELERAFDQCCSSTRRSPSRVWELPPIAWEVSPKPQRNMRIGPCEIDCFWPDQTVRWSSTGRPYHIAVQEIHADLLDLLGLR